MRVSIESGEIAFGTDRKSAGGSEVSPDWEKEFLGFNVFFWLILLRKKMILFPEIWRPCCDNSQGQTDMA